MSGIDEDRMPRIVRARFHYLYDHRGRRYIDLAASGGRAILGARPEGLSRELKNVLARGLLQSYPSVYARRLKNQTAGLIPTHGDIRILAGPERIPPALALAGAAAGGLLDPALEELTPDCAALWRPFCPADWNKAAVLVPVLPFPGDFAPALLCFRTGAGAAGPKDKLKDEPAAALLLAGLARAAALLAAALAETAGPASAGKTPGGKKPPVWGDFDGLGWPRKGPYLRFPRVEGEYPDFFRRGLQAGYILPPDPREPVIIPGELSPGEAAGLKKFLAAGGPGSGASQG